MKINSAKMLAMWAGVLLVGGVYAQDITADEEDMAFWESSDWDADTYAEASAPVSAFDDADGGLHITQPTQGKRAAQVASRAECVDMLKSYPWAIEHTELKLVHEHWRGGVRVNAAYRVLVSLTGLQSVATVLSMSDQELRVKWDAFGEECFMRRADGAYVHVKQGSAQMERMRHKVRRAAAVAGAEAVSESEYGWTDKVVDTVLFQDAPVMYETVKLVSPVMECEARLVADKGTLTTQETVPQAAEVLDYTGQKLHIRWETGWVESYNRADDGSYQKVNDTLLARYLQESELPATGQASWFSRLWNWVAADDSLLYETIQLKLAGQVAEVRLSMVNRLLVNMEPGGGWAKVVSRDAQRLVVRWHDMRDETFLLGVDGVFTPLK